MKQYDDYTQEELLNFTDEEIEKLIDLQCAVNGIPLLPKEPIPPAPIEVEPDVTVYEVAGFSFEDETTARRVAAAIDAETSLHIGYDWQMDSTYYVNGYSEEGATVKSKKLYSNRLYHESRSQRAQYKMENDAYEKLKKEYKAIESEREGAATEVWNAIIEARQDRDRKAAALVKFQRYLDLAEGNEVTALKFFTDAYPEEVDLLPETFEQEITEVKY